MKRIVAEFNVADDQDANDIAMWIDARWPDRDGEPEPDATVWPSAAAYLADAGARDLYEKCLHCHLFIFPNGAFEAGRNIMPWVHGSRGDDADERFEDHEPEPSGLIANLDTWRVFGPSMMRERFVTKDRAVPPPPKN